MDPRRTAWIVAAFAAALDLALVVCAYGFVSLFTGVEVVVDLEAGLFVAPAAIGASVIALLLTLAVTLRRPDRSPGRYQVFAGDQLALELREESGILVSTSSPPPLPGTAPVTHPFATAVFRMAEKRCAQREHRQHERCRAGDLEASTADGSRVPVSDRCVPRRRSRVLTSASRRSGTSIRSHV
ncbi:hypothetical protein JOE59_000294 [Agromyces cerinus]|uniref:DUF6121 family protein n=1 Tax=Agromyces cerinus TaxID=33878 RepID=UPI0019573036|nr:DUF6121 family protein [Agromyces cerinus]MBM7829589.1 hypothetical protein [Agromyces cerinus]